MATMKAAKLFGAKDTRVVEVERPTPGPGELLLAIKAVAICPSDLRLWEDGHAGGTYPDHPFTQGHEFSGVVAELGPGVEGPAPGTRVAVTPLWSCGKCDLCREGLSNICRNIVFPSFPQADGAMQEYMVVPAWAVEPLPDGVSFVQGALVEPLQAAVHGVSLAPIEPGITVAVVGAGIIGLSVLQAVRGLGAGKVFVADPLGANRELAEKLGATATASFATDFLDQLTDLADQPRIVFECSGHPKALGQAMELCRPAGLVVIIGVPHPDVIEFDTRPPRRKELHFVYSRRYRREDLAAGVAMVAEGKVDLGAYPVETYPLDQAPDAMRRADAKPEGILRVVVVTE
ncbi:MAG: alcohol dehydrogenase catalytic domain-containing protein [Armatimonadetes bacterium]|nr:alcohol dehydrogenase catalytic domain-containing protein [Armatimonadota bacterium]